MFGDVGESEAKVYRLAEEVRLALFGLAVQHETERASQDISISVAEPSALLQSDIVRGDSDRAGLDHTQFGPLMRPPPIKVIGRRYELSRLLGQGGMGSVFAGRDRLTGQQVAVKMLRSSLTHDSQAMLRARREAELAKRLSHPQLVRTLDVADGPDGSPALIMELLDGPTLSLRIQEQGPMQALEVVNIAKMLAGALGYLADQGVARIDLKPSNIIMEPRRGPVIIDLGVARDLEASNLTDAHSLIGTPMYMAPELIRGNTPDPRVDIYSLGLVLYYCLVGRNPWEHLGDVDAIMMAVLYQQIDVSGLSSSEELKHVIKRATERTPGSRYQTATEMLTALTATPESRT